MAYDTQLADKLRKALAVATNLPIEEKKAFGGLAFMVDDKMCINVSGENLMCRFDPELQREVEKRKGFLPMVMRDKKMDGYCYVAPEGFKAKKDFDYWLNLCLDFNDRAKSSKKKKRG